MNSRVSGRDMSAPERIRLAIETVEQAPAEALYAKLLRTLSEAGQAADMGGTGAVSRKIAFAYKLTVELGGKLGLLSQEHLGRRRSIAAALFEATMTPQPPQRYVDLRRTHDLD